MADGFSKVFSQLEDVMQLDLPDELMDGGAGQRLAGERELP